MKMQLRKILNFSAVDNQTIGGELKFIDKHLDSGIQIGEKRCICCIKIFQCCDGLLRHQQDMKRIRWLWMMKGQQSICLTHSLYRDNKTHMGKDPANQRSKEPKQSAHHTITHLRITIFPQTQFDPHPSK